MNRIYGIKENTNWFIRLFKFGNKRYTLYREENVIFHDDGWCWGNRWVRTTIENSDNLEYLDGKLDNLRASRV